MKTYQIQTKFHLINKNF